MCRRTAISVRDRALFGSGRGRIWHPPLHLLSNLEQAARPVALPTGVHEVSAEVEIGLVLVVSRAAQRDVVGLVRTAFPVGADVVILHGPFGAAAPTMFIHKCAATVVAVPDLAANRGWNCAGMWRAVRAA